ncbi:MAG: glycine cleavage system aminomethyltransferase GcvT [Candidatus Abyssobacteria bacterium SURF_17]|uniref:Glycine cleavage system aminomethyltransferase GcvT n=1 Tax=Candidatus Abyssobacteria bacterium SURF_17 TaxID=2093361 RepID=A0A419ESS1_9BACT|nr:MAG: glycine cleavage system aminomethyltransferase GcvT [Candidatus Abyssubacteria bacterium SURF_17]
MNKLRRTVFYDRHIALGAKMVEFAGCEMPLSYSTGIVAEHLATRKTAGLFDISHMGRMHVRGQGAVGFLQHVLSNNAQALEAGKAQYTFVPNWNGGAVDDAYLYCFVEGRYLLVVNADTRQKDWKHLQSFLPDFANVDLEDCTEELAMLALQGPMSRELLLRLIQSGRLPEPLRNESSIVRMCDAEVMVGRTGYTGEPICFELFIGREHALRLWNDLVKGGATPCGLGARDTLRLEANLPLYGHELGQDPEGKEIPLFAIPMAKFAVSFSPLKGDYVGRTALAKQQEAFERIVYGDYSLIASLPRMIQPIAMVGRGVARAGDKVFKDGRHVGYVTSGTTVPMWVFEGTGLASQPTDQHKLRAIGLALIDSDIEQDEKLTIEIRGKRVEAVVVRYHLRSEAPPYARPIVYGYELAQEAIPAEKRPAKALRLLQTTLGNSIWRQQECINLIPSEMTPSPMARLLSVMDPAFRYAEHKKMEAFYDADVFYYQGTDFIEEVERLLENEFAKFLDCEEIELRPISGQMANMTLFSAMVDYINFADRKREQRRIACVLNHHISKGGHLSAQPMGALRDYVARDPMTEKPAAINFPVRDDNRYRIDLPATMELIDEYRPELVIFGKSMFLHKEPVAEVRRFLHEQKIRAWVLYDAAHVFGLLGPHFQYPFREGADFVTGSTHKTFFGTQRGIIGNCFLEHEKRYELWRAVRRRAFPGSVSNHHLGTLVGLLMAAYEMNHFKDEYQRKVITNAKAFARALKDCGLQVAGDPTVEFTETHQVVIHVGYARGPEIARILEANNIICNYQATPDDEGFTAAGALRLGVAEMTRFGMAEKEFRHLAELIHEVISKGIDVREQVKKLRKPFCELQFCFRGDEYADIVHKLHRLL